MAELISVSSWLIACFQATLTELLKHGIIGQAIVLMAPLSFIIIIVKYILTGKEK